MADENGSAEVTEVDATEIPKTDYDFLAKEFLREKIESMYAAVNNPPIPEARAVDYLSKQIEAYDPEAYKDRKWNTYEDTEDFSKMRLKLQ